ncbi:hypothetical protein L1049_021121 [Liquidambar formosana]|uniref:Uncharacterized protein n=1 Tax=Liquidambar formosana TaxID=63359 RepID=A0AAP0SE19_LIQFO
MAKKKVTHQPKPPQEDLPQHPEQTLHATTPMDDPSEKIQSLKSLNSLLLKETHERRQQVDTLVKSKEALESELTRSVIERKALDAELSRLSDETVGLELEKSLMGVFVYAQMGEMGVGFEGLMREKVEDEKRLEGLEREIKKVRSEREVQIGVLKKKVNELMGEIENERKVSSHAMRERDEVNYKLGVQVEEANGLREKVVEMEERERKIEGEVRKLKMEYEGIVEEKEERESEIESLMRDKDLVERGLAESARVIEDLRREIEQNFREKKEMEEERKGQVLKIDELEKEVSELNESVSILQNEEKRLQMEVCELKKSNAEAVEEREKMLMEFDVLQKEKGEKERNIVILLEEKTLVMKSLEKALKELEDEKQKMEGIVQEKSEIEVVKGRLESEIAELRKGANELRNVVFTLQESRKVQEEENKRLQSDIGQYRDVIDRVTVERDDARKGFNEEKKNGLNLRLKVSEMEKSTEESIKEIERMRSEHEKLIEEKMVIQNQFESLMEDKDAVQKNLVKAQQDNDDMQAKMESVRTNSEQALMMLKNTAALVCMSKDESNGKECTFTDEQKIEDLLQPYAAELEAIKKAFKNKEMKLEDMKKQLEFMQNSVSEAHKKKSFWTLVSSATTVFAAISVAYVARGR